MTNLKPTKLDDKTQPPGTRMMRALGTANLTWRERCVLAAIAFHAGPGGAYPSMETLARECGCKRGRIAETISALIEKRVLAKRRGRTTNFYSVLI